MHSHDFLKSQRGLEDEIRHKWRLIPKSHIQAFGVLATELQTVFGGYVIDVEVPWSYLCKIPHMLFGGTPLLQWCPADDWTLHQFRKSPPHEQVTYYRLASDTEKIMFFKIENAGLVGTSRALRGLPRLSDIYRPPFDECVDDMLGRPRLHPPMFSGEFMKALQQDCVAVSRTWYAALQVLEPSS